MSRYDLKEYQSLPWVRLLFWFRIGFAVFVAVLIGSTVYGAYERVAAAEQSLLSLIGFVLISLILGLFVFVLLMMRPPATALTIDGEGVRLEFARGSTDVRRWNQPMTSFRGRYTLGVSDSVSRGQPLWSVYGRIGALPESFIPKSAFDELVLACESHGFGITRRDGRPGWTLYAITRHGRKWRAASRGGSGRHNHA